MEAPCLIIMKIIFNLLLYTTLLLTASACESGEHDKAAKASVKAREQAHLLSQHDEKRSPADVSNKQNRTLAAMPIETTLPQPKISDFLQGGKQKKKIKTDFYADDSFVIAYETKEETPQLKIILLTPTPHRNAYQSIDIVSLPFEGGVAVAGDIFFYDADQDGKTELFIIGAWRIEHTALGIDATTYRVYAYDNQLAADGQSLQPLTALMEKFGSGTEGELESGPSTYKYKDRQAIIDALESE